MLAAHMGVSRGHLGPSAHALWAINSATTLKHVKILTSVIPQDFAVSTALMRKGLSVVTARMVTLLKQTNVPAKHQVRKKNFLNPFVGGMYTTDDFI